MSRRSHRACRKRTERWRWASRLRRSVSHPTAYSILQTAAYTQVSSGSTADVTMLLEIGFGSLSCVTMDAPSM
jgi:hypothetical protein